jgi:hypothetical protein
MAHELIISMGDDDDGGGDEKHINTSNTNSS